MENSKLNDTVDRFLNPKKITPIEGDGKDQEVCDLQTGECYGIVERINKKYITEDGRQLLQD